METNKQAVIERLDACIQFMEETKKFIMDLGEAPAKTAEAPAKLADPHPTKKAGKAAKAEEPVETLKMSQKVKVEEPAAPVADEVEGPTAEDFEGYTEEELVDILESYEIKVPRKSKTKDFKVMLIDAVLQGIADGVILMEGEDADESANTEATDADGEETDGAGEEKPAEADDEDSDSDDSDGNDEGGPADSSDADEEVTMSEIIAGIHEMIVEGKIKMTEIKRTLSRVYEEDDDCKECKGCSKEDTIDCYLQAMDELLTDDDEVQHPFSDPYIRNDEAFCCGLPCHSDDGVNYVCTGHCKEPFKTE